MILTCPDCATSYFVDDNRIPRRGRTVRCSNCGARWRATPEGVVPLEDEAPPEPAAPQAISPEDDLEFVAAPVVKPKPPPPKRAPTALVIGLVVALGLAGVLGAAVAFRRQIAAHVPGAAEVFAAVGLPVDTMGLVLEGVAFKATFEAGRPVLAVTGAMRNTRRTAVQAPPLDISLLDRAGKPLSTVVAQPLNGRVPPGAKRYFAVTVQEPPAGAQSLEVKLDPAAKVANPAAPVAQPGPSPLQGKP